MISAHEADGYASERDRRDGF